MTCLRKAVQWRTKHAISSNQILSKGHKIREFNKMLVAGSRWWKLCQFCCEFESVLNWVFGEHPSKKNIISVFLIDQGSQQVVGLLFNYCYFSFLIFNSMFQFSSVAQLCPTLSDPMDCSLPGSSIHGIFQARILEWVAISFSRRSSQPRDWTQVSHIVGRCFTVWA